jgi:SM-20-related protein
MLFTHTDCLPTSRELTALWFLMDRWDVEWGGETLFFTDDGDAEFVATPKPGRLVVFDGAIRHVGRPPNRVCYAARYTFAIKLEPAS